LRQCRVSEHRLQTICGFTLICLHILENEPRDVEKKVPHYPIVRCMNMCMKKLAIENIRLLPPGTVDMFFQSPNCRGTQKLLAILMFTRCNIAIKIAAGQHEHEYFTLCRNVRKFQLKRRGKKRTRESPLCQQLISNFNSLKASRRDPLT